MSGRDLAQARRLERGAAGLRWFVVAFGVAQTAFAIRDQTARPDYVLPLEFVLVAALAIGNAALSALVERTASKRRLRWVGIAGFALDITVVTGLIWTSGAGPDDPIWVIAYVLPLEGAIRYGLVGAMIPVCVNLVSEFLRESYLVGRFPAHPFMGGALAFRVGIGLVVAVVAGLMARSLAREADKAGERAAVAEESALREARARREVSAFHAAILAGVIEEDLDAGLRSMATAIGRDLGCQAFAILLSETEPDATTRVIVAKGVHGAPGYELGDRLPIGEGRLAHAATGRGPRLWSDPAEAVVPLMVDNEPIGLLHEVTADPAGIDRERLLLLGRLADQVALVVHSGNLRARQRETLARLQELDEMKADFVAITSHELRTPLAAIRGFINTLRRRMHDLSAEETHEFLEIIDQQTERLIRLVEDLLVVSKIEAGKVTLHPEPVELTSLLGRILNGLGEGAARIERREDPDLPAICVVDPQRLGQILTNLLQNALKFSPPGGSVLLEAGSGQGATVRFVVEDRGAGIAADELGRIFDRFHQTDAAATRRSDGAGLGLYITKQLVEAMGGTIEVTSEVGAGSRFTVTLPTMPGVPVPARPSAGATSG